MAASNNDAKPLGSSGSTLLWFWVVCLLVLYLSFSCRPFYSRQIVWPGPIFPALRLEKRCLIGELAVWAVGVAQSVLPAGICCCFSCRDNHFRREKWDHTTLSDENIKGDAKKTNRVRVGTLAKAP